MKSFTEEAIKEMKKVKAFGVVLVKNKSLRSAFVSEALAREEAADYSTPAMVVPVWIVPVEEKKNKKK